MKFFNKILLTSGILCGIYGIHNLYNLYKFYKNSFIISRDIIFSNTSDKLEIGFGVKNNKSSLYLKFNKYTKGFVELKNCLAISDGIYYRFENDIELYFYKDSNDFYCILKQNGLQKIIGLIDNLTIKKFKKLSAPNTETTFDLLYDFFNQNNKNI
jgi:hypothetical protein